MEDMRNAQKILGKSQKDTPLGRLKLSRKIILKCFKEIGYENHKLTLWVKCAGDRTYIYIYMYIATTML
jgi:hypothetical protein